MRRFCSISVDIDPLSAYYQIHGLGAPPPQVSSTLLKKALPRFAELFDQLSVKSTLFCIGSDLDAHPESHGSIRHLAEQGHEIGNHTYHHRYDLCRLSEPEIETELRRAHDTIGAICGSAHTPVGFRSPGYSLNATLLRVLEKYRYRYDSSMFPSPVYYSAKAAVMGGMSLRGRQSAAVLADPRMLLAPVDPYRPDREKPWCRGDAELVELPVAVTPITRLPVIGTSLVVAPEKVRDLLLSSMAKRAFFNFELHGIDLVDAVEDRIPTELAGRQPDLRIPFTQKVAIFKTIIQRLQRDFEIVPLKVAATLLSSRVS